MIVLALCLLLSLVDAVSINGLSQFADTLRSAGRSLVASSSSESSSSPSSSSSKRSFCSWSPWKGTVLTDQTFVCVNVPTKGFPVYVYAEYQSVNDDAYYADMLLSSNATDWKPLCKISLNQYYNGDSKVHRYDSLKAFSQPCKSQDVLESVSFQLSCANAVLPCHFRVNALNISWT